MNSENNNNNVFATPGANGAGGSYMVNSNTVTSSVIATSPSNIMSVPPAGNITSANILTTGAGAVASNPQWTFTANVPNIYNTTYNAPTAGPVLTLYKSTGGEIVRLNTDGSVVWAQGIDIDEAADSFARSIRIGAEMQAGLTQSVKQEMRNTVFEELIEIAKEKGPLSAEELTYLLQASKIMEKLKGGK